MLKRILLSIAASFLMLAAMTPSAWVRAQSYTAPQVFTNAKFRVVVAANLTTPVDVYLDGVITSEAGLAAVKPLDAGGFVTVTPGSHTITLDQTGTTTPVGTSFVFNFLTATYINVILLPDMTWMTIADVSAAPATSQATAHVINLSPSNNPAAVSVDGVTPSAFASIAYKTASAYVPFTVATHSLMVVGSTMTPLSKAFIDGNVYSIFVFWNPVKSMPKMILSTEFSFIKTIAGPFTDYLPILYH